MNTDKLIPIDFSRNITPFVIGDTLFNSRDKVEFKITQKEQVDVFNSAIGYVKDNDDSIFFVVSFADRPNTGNQPVGDDVFVDITTKNKCMYDQKPAANFKYWWTDGTIKTWRPNHAATLKQWQAEQGGKSKEWPSCDSQENIGPGVDYAESQKAKAKPLDVSGLGAAPSAVFPFDKPTFTQAQADAGELPVGSDVVVIFREVESVGTVKYVSDLGFVLFKNGEEYYYEHKVCEVKPIQTDEEKLRDAINELWDAAPDKWAIIEDILNNDLFTITLKG